MKKLKIKHFKKWKIKIFLEFFDQKLAMKEDCIIFILLGNTNIKCQNGTNKKCVWLDVLDNKTREEKWLRMIFCAFFYNVVIS